MIRFCSLDLFLVSENLINALYSQKRNKPFKLNNALQLRFPVYIYASYRITQHFYLRDTDNTNAIELSDCYNWHD